METIAAVLTFKSDTSSHDLTTSHYGGNAKRARLLLKSIVTFAPNVFDEILIICPRAELSIAEEIAKNIDLNIRIVDESSILPPSPICENVPSWYRQQICKLRSYTLTDCSCLLQLDPDMLIRHHVTKDDFFVSGKLLTQLVTTSVYPERWRASGDLVQYFGPIPPNGLCVTPALLCADTCRRLDQHLAELYGKPGQLVLAEHSPKGTARTWTEYCCYTLFSIKKNIWEDRHEVSGVFLKDKAAMFARFNVWHPEHAVGITTEKIFNADDKGIFFIFQSASGISAETYVDLVEPYIGAFSGEKDAGTIRKHLET